ncbi:MAG: T9SS type A sorting domain-containing protein [Bacteroidetes bacterium]|nr:T9SS type A sorting domain-containing protein [Bacteroidota bacterium]
MKKFLTSCAFSIPAILVNAQCPVGQSEVTIDVTTDAYGYEIYWELVPGGNSCGTGTLFAGGNMAVGCGGGGAQNQTPGGYANNTTVSEGPWCLTDGASYDLIFVDDWGDGGASFTINVAGFPVFQWSSGSGAGSGSVYTFVVEPPLPWDIQGESISVFNYVNIGNVDITGTLFNSGSNVVTSFDINYQIDNGAIITAPLSGLNIPPFTDYSFIHPTQWNAAANGTYSLKIWASNLDGNADMDNTNDTIQKNVIVGPGIPNLVDNYLGIIPEQTVIANGSDGIEIPRDLDFHPTLSNNELWVILKSTEASGGKTVKISDAGEIGQTELVQQDDNAWHFMSLPTGIAFSENGNFATSPGVYDSNHDGGAPFTGPALWSSDPAIYAQPSGGNGSHLDMLHESPYSMGIAHESDNVFWVFDGQNNCVTRYDFGIDHGPGNSDHSDGIVRRYSGMGLSEDPAYEVSSHLVLDKATNWLYIVDTGNDRIVRLDITSGSQTGTFVPYEGTFESSIYGGYTSEVYVSTGLTQPSGIDIVENRMIVSDYTTGQIMIYDISGSTVVELGQIQTGTPGIMGVKFGPDGKIWYVNAITNEVVRLEFNDVTGLDESNGSEISVYPNPVNTGVITLATMIDGAFQVNIVNATGQVVANYMLNEPVSKIDVSAIAPGHYILQVIDSNNGTVINKKIVVSE